MPKGLVTFSLWGDEAIYNVGMLRQIGIWQDSPLDVDLRVYVCNDGMSSIKDQLSYYGVDVRKANTVCSAPRQDQTGTFWRFGAFADAEGYDYILSRDVDSRPYEREFIAIQDWLESHKEFHIIRDHIYHGVPILAGLFGVRKEIFQFVSENLPSEVPADFYRTVNNVCGFRTSYKNNDFYQVDQWWLRLKLYPLLKNKILAHDEYFGFERKRFRMFLPERSKDLRFVGEGFTEFDEPRFPEHREMLRPKYGYEPRGVRG